MNQSRSARTSSQVENWQISRTAARRSSTLTLQKIKMWKSRPDELPEHTSDRELATTMAEMAMSTEQKQNELVCRALGATGTRWIAFWPTYCPDLAAHVKPRLPVDLQGQLSIEETIGGFPSGPEAFCGWVASIIDHRLLDLIRAVRAAKRGGGRMPVHAQTANMTCLLEQVAVNSRTPSMSAAGHEASSAVSAALDQIPAVYRQALKMRCLDGLSPADIAARMGRWGSLTGA